MGNPLKLGLYNYRFGAIAAGISITFSLMLFFMDMTYNQSSIIQSIQMIIPAALAIIAILSFKRDNNNFLSIKQALKISVGVYLITAIIGLFYFAFFINVIETDFITNTAELQAEALRLSQPGLSEDIIKMQQENTEKFFYVSFPFILVINIFFGLIIGLITGLLTKKNS